MDDGAVDLSLVRHVKIRKTGTCEYLIVLYDFPNGTEISRKKIKNGFGEKDVMNSFLEYTKDPRNYIELVKKYT